MQEIRETALVQPEVCCPCLFCGQASVLSVTVEFHNMFHAVSTGEGKGVRKKGSRETEVLGYPGKEERQN